MSDQPPQVQPVHLQVDLDPQTAQGVFVNMAMVNHTETEFTLDLVYVQPQAPKATVRARVITTPKHMKRLLFAIEDNLQKYEARFGPVEVGPTKGFPPPTPAN
ncbi:MAG TPA: DUF3467 domain-containing protein [Anaeromyxobacter sp.]|nr:DUF3467 domain-containing protein [Anaeromyxobacter sp.]